MHKNTFKPLCMLAAITLAFGISTSSAHAADTDLSITQKIDKITGKESQQKYTINYTDENKNTALKIEYDRGFYAKELKVGDWDNYTGKIKITAYSKDTKSPVMTTEADENATVSLENYSNIDWIEMNPANEAGTQEDTTETHNIKDVDLSGIIYAGKSGKTVQVKGSVWPDDTYSGNAVCEKVITTIANDYTVASPYVQVNPDQVNYLGSTAMMIKNLQGSLKAGQLNSYHVTFNIPARMFVDSITLPKFDNASYKLYVNGNQMDTRNSKIYVNDKAANISMDITPNGDFFSQSQDMVIDMRNTVNQSGDNKVSVSVLAVCGNGCEFKADSNAMPIKYQEQTVTPSEPDTPETPSEPEQPDTPETPTLPDTTGTDTKKNNHQTTVKKNNTVTSLDLIKEDSDDTDTKKETVVDLSGVNLQSAKATKNSINTFSNPNATKKSTSLAGLNSERIQTTDIQDFENSDDTTDNQNIKDQVASTDDGIMDESPGGHESAAQKAKETVSDNRGVQLGLIIGGIVLAGIVIVIIVSKRMGKEEISTVTKEEEKPDTIEDQESGSLDQSEELNTDDTKEPKYEHWMFQDLQAYYRLANKHLDNKSSDARRDLSRVLNHPNRYLFGYDYIVHGLNRRAMKATVYAKEKEPWKLNAAEGNIDLFFMLLKNLRGKKPSDFLRSLYSIGKYKKYLEDYADFRNMEVRDLSSIWKEYQHDASTYNDWVEWGKYIVKYNKELKETLKNKDGIMLSTMHGSKGLEWKHVFIIDCVEGVCPSPKAETAEELEEERRLFYVAMTRAKEHLYLCYYKAEEGKTVVASPYIM